MARRAQLDVSQMTDFARWLLARLEAHHLTLGALASASGVNESYLHKILKSYLPRYRQYQRPGYDKTLALGRCLGDAAGALRAAGYDPGPVLTEGSAVDNAPPALPVVGDALPALPVVLRCGPAEGGIVPENAEDWPPELLEAMHYSQALSPDVQRYIYGLWREQARVYAALAQSQNGGDAAHAAALLLGPSGRVADPSREDSSEDSSEDSASGT